MTELLGATWAGRGPRVALLHGFTQTARSWAPLADVLAGEFEVVAVDLPGHGRSADMHRSLADAVESLVATVGPAIWVGYSLGGRHALEVALRRPDAVAGLVLLGATAGLEDPAERAARRAADEALAVSIVTDGVPAFIARWLATPLFAGLPAERAGVEDRLTNPASGLAASLRLAGTGTQDPSWDRLGGLPMPVLVLAGAGDDKFRALGERMARQIGENARFASVPGAGHSAHLEAPDAFLAELLPFLREVGTGGLSRPAPAAP